MVLEREVGLFRKRERERESERARERESERQSWQGGNERDTKDRTTEAQPALRAEPVKERQRDERDRDRKSPRLRATLPSPRVASPVPEGNQDPIFC